MANTANNIVFVIHGRNDRIRDGVFAFLRAIGLNPREWSVLLSNSGSGAPYIGDILERAFAEARAVVAVLTPDDLTYLRCDLQGPHDPGYEKTPTGQARPNVLFEMGMAFGREPKRTVIVTVGTLRPFSDASGLFVVRLGNDSSSRTQLANLLQACECAVDRTGTDWLNSTTIDFSATGVGFEPAPAPTSPHIKVLRTPGDILAEEIRITNEAKKTLATTGSRSRDPEYLDAIVRRLAAESTLVYYRVLMGSPYNQVLKDHLVRVLNLRDPKGRTHGYQTLFLGLFDDDLKESEKFICASERRALVVLPSLTSVGRFDTALVYEAESDAQACVQFVQQLYQASKPIETTQQVSALQVLRSGQAPSAGM